MYYFITFFIVFFCFHCHAKQSYPLDSGMLQEKIDQAVITQENAFSSFEKSILQEVRNTLHHASSFSIFLKAKRKNMYQKYISLKNLIKKGFQKGFKSIYQQSNNLPVEKFFLDGATLGAGALGGCLTGLIAGAPLEVSMTLAALGMAVPTVAISSCVIGGVITTTPLFADILYEDAKGIYRIRKLQKEIDINQKDLLFLKEQLHHKTLDGMENCLQNQEDLLILNNQIIVLEYYIQRLKDKQKEVF